MNLDASLNEIESLLKNSFKDAIVWDQKGTSLVGKYVYIKYEEENIGLFIGYVLDNSIRIKAAIAFIFPHVSRSMWSDEARIDRRLFYKILLRSNLKLKDNHYRIVNGRKLPAMIRTLSFKDGTIDASSKSIQFFNESMSAIKQSQPIYKVMV